MSIQPKTYKFIHLLCLGGENRSIESPSWDGDKSGSFSYSSAMSSVSAYSLTYHDWKNLLVEFQESENVLPFLLDGLYKNRNLWEKHLSGKLLEKLFSRLTVSLPEIKTIDRASDGTVKFLMKMSDQESVETVLIPFHKRYTICLSTQVGCAMNCSFCYTGTQGLKRNLTAGEIVGQYLVARQWHQTNSPKALSPAVVFMGQGEPLHNCFEVEKAIRVLTDRACIGLGHRQMTLSTVGPANMIPRLKNFPRINIALSLHSPFNQERSVLIPANERYPLEKILPALNELPLLPRQFITYEYLLIKNFNITQRHADGLEILLKDKKALINLIPFNPYPGSKWERPDTEEIERFKEWLVQRRLRVMIRTTKGAEILAACGQLKVIRPQRNHE
jgi:23S rRNA (adenine2503-C2)-methyltransferase